jgi:uncharacterized membrane protein
MAKTAPDAPKTRRPWGKIVLFVSLALNLLVVGVVIGAVVNGPRDRDRNPALRDLGFGPFVHALPRADRRELGEALLRQAGAFRQNRAEMRASFEAFLGALRAEPFDPDVLLQVVNDQQVRITERQALGRQLLLDRIEAMTPDQRSAYANDLDRSLRRGDRRSNGDR